MSKAMEALKALYEKATHEGICNDERCVSCCDAVKAYALLRDYITTTEAEREGLEPGELVAKGDCPICGGSLDIVIGEDEGELSVVGKPLCGGMERETVWTNAEDIQRQLGRDESAARIKELEEALIEAEQSLHAIATQAGRDYLTDLTQIRGYANSRAMVARKAALSGARKVGA